MATVKLDLKEPPREPLEVYDHEEGVRNCSYGQKARGFQERGGEPLQAVNDFTKVVSTSFIFPQDICSQEASHHLKTRRHAPLRLLAATSARGHSANPPTPSLPALGVTSL